MPPNSGSARGVFALSASSVTGPLLPSPFPLDDSAQGLAAGRATKPPGRVGVGACEMLFAPGTIAAKNFGFRCWALALARLLRTLGRRVRRRRIAGLGCRCPQAFSPTRPVLAVLSLAFCPTVGSPPIPLAGPSSPPESSLGAALRATVSGLGMCGVKGFLAALEQTVSLPRLTCPLTGISLVASLMWAQGSCELPTAKSRTRSFLPPLRGAFLDHDPPIGRPLPSKYTTTNPRVQATRVGTRPLKPTGYRLVPHSLEEWCPRSLLLTPSASPGRGRPHRPTRL